jgi:hypothetical protein
LATQTVTISEDSEYAELLKEIIFFEELIKMELISDTLNADDSTLVEFIYYFGDQQMKYVSWFSMNKILHKLVGIVCSKEFIFKGIQLSINDKETKHDMVKRIWNSPIVFGNPQLLLELVSFMIVKGWVPSDNFLKNLDVYKSKILELVDDLSE